VSVRTKSASAIRGTGRFVRRSAWPVLFTIVLAGVLVLGVFPTRTYIQKRQDVAETEVRLQQLNDANAKAEKHVEALQSDAEIERIAREQYNLVKPGEETYHVLPAPKDPVQIPDVWPFNRFHTHLGK
jgi:cell division protein FtsB